MSTFLDDYTMNLNTDLLLPREDKPKKGKADKGN